MSTSIVIAETEERLHCIWMEGGCPAKVRLIDEVDQLGTVLTQLGALQESQLPNIIAYAERQNILLGEATVRVGAAPPEVVQQALATQIIRRIARLFALESGTYGLYEANFLADFGGNDSPTVDVLPVITAGVRSCYGIERLDDLLRTIWGNSLKLETNVATLRRYLFDSDETKVVQALIKGSTSLGALSDLSRFSAEALRIAVYTLLVTEQVRVGAPARRAGGPPPPPSGAGKARSRPEPKKAKPKPKADSERRRAVLELIETSADMNHFELLGAAVDADDAEIQKAYIERARRFHPDRASGDIADLRSQMADLFARISVAHQTLKDPTARAEYASKVKATPEGSSPPEEDDEDQMVQDLLDAETAFQKAKIILKMNQVDEAEQLARQAAEANKEHGEYAALLAWIEGKKRPRDANVDDLIDRLKSAAKLAPKSEDAHFYLAETLRRAGRNREALKSYEEVHELNRHNVDALRMVRILRKQKDQAPAKAKGKEKGGLFGALFKDIGGKK